MNPGQDLGFLNSGWIWFFAAAAVFAVSLIAGIAGSRGLSVRRRWMLTALRTAALVLAISAVLRPAMRKDVTRLKRAPLSVLIDTSSSMKMGDPSFASVVRDWLKNNDSEFSELSDYFALEYKGLGNPAPQLIPGSPLDLSIYSDTETPLAATLIGLAESASTPYAAILLSDGRDTENPGAFPPRLPFPVYPVTPGDGRGTPDLWIDSVDVPPVAFIRTPVILRVNIGMDSLPDSQASVTLLEGGSPLVSRNSFLKSAGMNTVELSFTPRRIGRKAYTVEVAPVAGETSMENNRYRFPLSVIRDKTRVLLVAGTPSWDVKFLRRRLRQDPGIDLITFMILRTPRDLNLVAQKEMSLIPFPTRELFSEELPSFDVVIFINFDYSPYVPRQYLKNIRNFVMEDGGGFVMIGGDRSFSLGGYQGSPLADILPVDITGASSARMYLNKPFRPRMTEAGAAHPIFQWKADSAENMILWKSLPEMEGMNWMLKARPGAVVLAENPESRNEHGAMPVVALGEYGSGRTISIAADSLWRWALVNAGRGGDDSVYREFWTRLLRWVMHDPDMALVRLGLPAGEVRAGKRISLSARVLDRVYKPARSATLTGRLYSDSGSINMPLSWSETAPGSYSSENFSVPGEGTWTVELEASLNSVLLGRDMVKFPVSSPSPEGLRVGLDTDFLEALAERSGGRVYSSDDSSLFSMLEGQGRSNTEVVGRRIREIWPIWPLLGLAIMLFAADWSLRRYWS